MIGLVLGGGNALGSYLAGAYECLHERGIAPDWIVGASVGAVTGALLLGSAPEERVDKLRAFWAEAKTHTPHLLLGNVKLRQWYNGAHVALAAMFGRPGIFRHRYPGLWSVLPGIPNDIAVYDHSPLRRTLERFVDFDRLNSSETRLSICCVDIETGEEVYFDNTRDKIGPEHLMASTAITPAFPPVEVGGRLLCDPGYTNNLPVDHLFTKPPDRDFLCIAIELFSLRAPRPASLDAVLERTHDILFASAPRRTIEALRREYELRARLNPDGPSVRLLHLAYQAASHELSAKSLDFSPSSVDDRWAAGHRNMASGLALIETAPPRPGQFAYLSVDPRAAFAAAEAGAVAEADPILPRVA